MMSVSTGVGPNSFRAAVLTICLAFGGTPGAAFGDSPHPFVQNGLGLLSEVEDSAEAIAEGEQTNSAAMVGARRAITLWPIARRSLERNGSTATELAPANAAIQTLRSDANAGVDLTHDANEVTGALAPLFTRAGDRVPAGVHFLDYLGRAVKLDVHSGDWSRARRDAGVLRARWTAFRAKVAARSGGEAAAAEFDRAVGALGGGIAARSAAKALAASALIGNAVDGLEKVF